MIACAINEGMQRSCQRRVKDLLSAVWQLLIGYGWIAQVVPVYPPVLTH
jgi:hypothetical protein